LHADHEITHEGHGVYTVPGCSGGTYRVDLVPFGGEESCSCPDFLRHKTPCKHIFSATIWRSKSRAASLRTQRPKLSPEAVEAGLGRMGA
jgi:predicted nucleic acid-binding Zn finger protein